MKPFLFPSLLSTTTTITTYHFPGSSRGRKKTHKKGSSSSWWENVKSVFFLAVPFRLLPCTKVWPSTHSTVERKKEEIKKKRAPSPKERKRETRT